MDLTRASTRLSLVLRHRPESIGITLDEHGWVPVPVLLAALAAHGLPLSVDDLQRVVTTNDKQRFQIVDGDIRAQQGHSVDVDLALEPAAPPSTLFHGTVERFLPAIRTQGLLPRSRRHVHLSAGTATAAAVGNRHGEAVVLTVTTAGMTQPFYLSGNGVWLTGPVAPEHLTFP